MTRFDHPVVVRDFNFLFPLMMATSVAGLGSAVLVSTGAAWAVLARAGRAGHLYPLGRTLGENTGVS